MKTPEVEKIRAISKELTIALPGSPAYKRTFLQNLHMTTNHMVSSSKTFFIDKQKRGHELYTTSEDGQLTPSITIEYEGEQEHETAGTFGIFKVTLHDLQPGFDRAFAEMLPILAEDLNGRSLIESPVYCLTGEEQREIEDFIADNGTLGLGD
ncbi:MAG: hypothetical protein LC687_04760 [Actinobacteria bacterium]|nr:hypothetical protein [Actinomycetota bacterium]MCA1807145.1 hypothetical protein [Actinomycetota bacterium]